MIYVNLLKQRPPVNLNSVKEPVPFKRIAISALLVGGVIAGSVLFFTREKTPIIKDVAVVPVETSKVESPTNEDPLVDSVTEQKDSKNSMVRSSYSEMSMIERFNYEHAYAEKLFQEIAQISAEDIDYSTISMKNYQTIVSEGNAASEPSIVNLFVALKSDYWQIEPKPASLFRSLGTGFQFRFEGAYNANISASEKTVISQNSIPPMEKLQSMKDSLNSVLSKTAVNKPNSLELLDTEVEGNYRHYLYTVNGEGSYTDFRSFLAAIKSTPLPASVSDAELKADSQGVKWRVVIRITVI